MQPRWHLLLLCTVFLPSMPTVFAVSNPFKIMQDAFNAVFQIILTRPMVQSYIHVFSKLPFLRATMNTFLIAATVTIFKIVTSLLMAYSSAHFDFRGKGILYFTMLATMFISFIVTAIPNYLVISKIGLSDGIWGATLSQPADALGVFLLCQSIRGIPRTLIEVTRMENVENLKIMGDIIIPSVRPSAISTGVIFFISSWSEHVWSVLILKNKENYTLSLVLQIYINAGGRTEFIVAMAVSVITMVVPLALYILFRRYTINTFVMSDIKGQNMSGNPRSRESNKEK